MAEKEHEAGPELQLLMKDERGGSGGESGDELISGDTERRAVETKTNVEFQYAKPFKCGRKPYSILAVILLVFVFTILGLTIGLLVGNSLGRSSVSTPTEAPTSFPEAKQLNWGDKVILDGKEVNIFNWLDEVMSADNIKNNLETLTANPHIAGSEENHMLAQLIYNQWKGFNFDSVDLVNYSVLLSYPNTSQPNVLKLMQGSEVIYKAKIGLEPPHTPGENNSNVAPPFNAYSGSGTATGPLVYVNYARIEDFFYLTRNLSLNLTNHVCIARYGFIYRGSKARLAQHFNCSALLIYSDPKDYAPAGVPVYPDGPSLPLYGVQRGSLFINGGDPVTPGVPAIDGFYRIPYSKVLDNKDAPSIPVQPLSYGDAVHFLSQLEDLDVPNDDWVGGLNITYKIVQSNNNTNYTVLEVNNYQETRTIYNVIASIYGAVEPDHFVILGNHRDAWTFGAVDPNSGTAALMEVAQALKELRNIDNWRPGRTITLCSWDAEEYGLIGSTEFVEDKGKLLRDNTVAYLNVDGAVSGSELLRAQASPLIFQPLWNATKMVKSLNSIFDTVYDEWLHADSKDYNGTRKPTITGLGSGSDYVPFLQRHGITSSSMSYVNRTNYAVYHSVHDNFYWMSHFCDPSFNYHLTISLIWMKLALILSTDPVLPFDPRDYAIALDEIYQNLSKERSDILYGQGISLEYLEKAIADFTAASVNLYNSIQDVKGKIDVRSDENVVRIINNQLMNIERAFIHDDGLPGRSYFKHIIFAPSSVNIYGSSLFPGVSDTIFNAVNFGGSWDEVRRQLDFARNHIRYATTVMAEPSLNYVSRN